MSSPDPATSKARPTNRLKRSRDRREAQRRRDRRDTTFIVILMIITGLVAVGLVAFAGMNFA